MKRQQRKHEEMNQKQSKESNQGSLTGFHGIIASLGKRRKIRWLFLVEISFQQIKLAIVFLSYTFCSSLVNLTYKDINICNILIEVCLVGSYIYTHTHTPTHSYQVLVAISILDITVNKLTQIAHVPQ